MKPTVLLLPGIFNDATLWDPVAALLGPVAEVRAMDALTQESIAAMAQAAWERVADLPSGAPVVLVGFSMGGYVAIEMLARPQRPLRAAVLCSTSARPESPEAAATREKTIAALPRHFERVVDGILQFGTHEAAGPVRERLRPMMLALGPDVAIRQNRATMGRADHREALARLDLPLTVLCGRQDRITPPELSQELAALVPRARLELLDTCGHMLPAERPEPLAAAVRARLD